MGFFGLCWAGTFGNKRFLLFLWVFAVVFLPIYLIQAHKRNNANSLIVAVADGAIIVYRISSGKHFSSEIRFFEIYGCANIICLFATRCKSRLVLHYPLVLCVAHEFVDC